MRKHLLTLYTRTPLHIGSGTSVEIVDLPIMRERITNFPVCPSTSIKGVLRDECRRHPTLNADTESLFGHDPNEENKEKLRAGCLVVTDAKILAFPVRSLAGCFAWLTCPLVLERLKRDWDPKFEVPQVPEGKVIAGKELNADGQVVLEEYALDPTGTVNSESKEVKALLGLCEEELWRNKLANRLAIVNDDTFQHFVNTTTEITARIAIDPKTRTNTNLFNQENIPTETLFYALLFTQRERTKNGNGLEEKKVGDKLVALMAASKLLQIGGDETTGFGFCSTTLLSPSAPAN